MIILINQSSGGATNRPDKIKNATINIVAFKSKVSTAQQSKARKLLKLKLFS